jgi:hypothetical protein
VHISLTVEVALGAGALLAIFGLPPKQARFWLKWGKIPAVLCLIGYFILGAAAGILGYAIATWLHWKPTDSAWLNGIIFAVGGHAVARASGATFNASEANEVGSLLSLGAQWFKSMLNDLTDTRVSKWMNNQDEAQVAKVARQLLGRLLGQYSLEQAAVALPAEDYRTAVLLNARLTELANKSDDAEREVALHGLMEFCKQQYCARYLLRP